jgi:hypothetical protein
MTSWLSRVLCNAKMVLVGQRASDGRGTTSGTKCPEKLTDHHLPYLVANTRMGNYNNNMIPYLIYVVSDNSGQSHYRLQATQAKPYNLNSTNHPSATQLG